MTTTKGYWLIGGLLVVNLFVLYYQSGEFTNSTKNRKEVIGKALPFHVESKPDFYKKETPNSDEAFDATDCVGRPFMVYVHKASPRLSQSKEAQFIQHHLLKSPYSTKDLKKACLFVYLAHEGENVAELPFWTRNGEALVLIYLSGSNPSLLPPNRRSFVVGLQATNSYDLDIYTRVLNSSSTNYQLLSQIYPFKKRQFLLNVMTARPTKDLTRHFSSSMSKTVSVNFDCKSTGDRIMGMCENDEYRIEQLKNSVFTLLLPSMDRFSNRFYEALFYGSIPVVIGNERGNYLPFSDFIEWKRAALILPPHFISQVQTILPQFGVDKIVEMRRNGRFYLENYLLDAKVLVRSILTAYRNKLGLVAPKERTFKASILYATHPNADEPKISPTTVDLSESISYQWNYNPTQMDFSSPKQLGLVENPLIADMDNWIENQKTININKAEFKEHLSGNFKDEKFTVVIVSYKRDDQLAYTLKMLNNTRFLDRILVVWNDIQRSVPSNLIPTISVPIFVLNATRNSLNNRFLPFDLIRTQAIFNMDDDFNTDLETFEFSFRVWRENRHAIVGPNFRLGYMKKFQQGVYEASGQCQHNMVLTSGAFLHRAYHFAYTNMLNAEMHAHIDSIFNCEDIAINFLVSHLTRRPPIKTTPIINTSGLKTHTGLHQRGNSHYTERSKCIAKLVEIFGYNPLIVSEFRAHSVLKGGRCYNST